MPYKQGWFEFSVIDIKANQVDLGLPMKDCIESITSLYTSEADIISKQPTRVVSRIDQDSIILTMPGFSSGLSRFVVKVVTEYKKNPERFGRKIQGGTVLLFDSTNSELLAMIDSARLTAIRTGAVSGLATKLLAREDSRKVGIIGSGEQARTMLQAVCSVREISEVYVYSRDLAHAKKFADEMSGHTGLKIQPVESHEELKSHESDILNVATNSLVPVVRWKDDIVSGMHINSIGTLPERQELDIDTVRNSRVFVDYKEGVLKEAGDVMKAIKENRINESHIIGDLSDLITKKTLGRIKDSDVTLFKSVGFALQDVYAASKLYQNVSK